MCYFILRVQKRTSEDPFWTDDKNASDVDETGDSTTKSDFKVRSDNKEYQNENEEVGIVPPGTEMSMDKLRGFHMKKTDSPSSKAANYTPERVQRSRSMSHSKTPEKKDGRYRSRSTSRKRYR